MTNGDRGAEGWERHQTIGLLKTFHLIYGFTYVGLDSIVLDYFMPVHNITTVSNTMNLITVLLTDMKGVQHNRIEAYKGEPIYQMKGLQKTNRLVSFPAFGTAVPVCHSLFKRNQLRKQEYP